MPADGEGAAALRAQGLAAQRAELRPHEGRGVRGVEGEAHLLHGGDGRQPRDRLPLRPGGPGLERRDHHGACALQEPAGDAGGARPAQLPSSGAAGSSSGGTAQGIAASQESDGDGPRLGRCWGERDPCGQVRPPLCSPETRTVATGRLVLALAPPVPGQDRGTTRAGLAQPPVGTTGQRTRAGPRPGASDKARGDTPAWSPQPFIQLTRAGPWCTGGDPRTLLQDRGWMRLCPKDPCDRELCMCDSDTGTDGCGWVPVLKRVWRAASAARTPQQGTAPMAW